MGLTGNYSWRGGLCMEVKPVPNFIVIFGASGDLANRKLIPALFHLYRRGLLHEDSRIFGCARTEMEDESFREALKPWFAACGNCEKLPEFLKLVHYCSGDYGDEAFYVALKQRMDALEMAMTGRDEVTFQRIFYLATPSTLYETIVNHLDGAKLTAENEDGVPARNVVLEKPFGTNLDSARALDKMLHSSLKERQIYRIDHYLGKETVQNILILRFANTIFEPVWNANYIDNIQITAAESVGVEHRAGYFDRTGLLRDMFQNHMLEMLSLVAMELPCSSEADDIRNEKLKLLKSIRPIDRNAIKNTIVRGQYSSGAVNGITLPGYREETGIATDSMTETYVAMRLFVDNWRWRGVPFYLRSGKRLAQKTSRIVITFKPVPHSIFSPIKNTDFAPNCLTLNVQPEEGISMSIQAKQPGPKLCIGALDMDFKYDAILEKGESMPDAYQRLLLDCMLCDQTLFIRNDTIEYAWSILTPILEAWQSPCHECGELAEYPAGSWGPPTADSLFLSPDTSWK